MTDFKKWNKITKDLITETEEDDIAQKAAASAALGHTDAVLSKDHEKEIYKKEQAKLAKAALDRQKSLEESLKFTIDSTSIPPKSTTNKTPFEVNEAYLKGKKLLSFKNMTDAYVIIPNHLDPLIKIFVDNCTNLTLSVSRKLLTSHIELYKCVNCSVSVIEERLSTIQIDLSSDINIICTAELFDGDDDRIYHAGVSNLTVSVLKPDGSVASNNADYKKDGAKVMNEATIEEFQFVTMFNGKEVITQSLMRVGNKFLTGGQFQDLGLTEDDEDTVLTQAVKVEKLKEAELHKLEGNDAFKAGEYAQAILFYSMAVEKAFPLVPVPSDEEKAKEGFFGSVCEMEGYPEVYHLCLSNRSACFLKLGHHDKALLDALLCTQVAPFYIKGLFRKGLALHALGRYEEAMPCLGKCLKMEPGNKQVKDAVKFCEVKLEQMMRKRMQE